jgi:hypothetical protein
MNRIGFGQGLQTKPTQRIDRWKMSTRGQIVKRLAFAIGIAVVFGLVIFETPTMWRGPNYVPGGCALRLEAIDAAKSQWALENHRTTNDVPTWDDLQPYLPQHMSHVTNGVWYCPMGGHYTLGRLGEPATCSIGGTGHSFQP